MNKSNFKQIFLTLALLITAATGAWADNVEAKIGTTEYATLGAAISSAQDGDIIQLQSDVVLTAENIVEKGITIDFNGYIISTAENTWGGIWWAVDMTFTDSNDTSRGGMKCYYGQYTDTNAKANLCGGRYDDPAEAFTTGTYAYCYNIPTGYEIVNINADGSADADGFKSRVVRNYLNETNTVATMEMPASDVTVTYELVRDLAQQVTFGGIPTGDGLVVKNNGTAYEFVTTPDFTLTDALAATDAQNIISAEGITIIVGKMVEVEGIEGHRQFDEATAVSLADFLANPQPGIYKIKATANADGPYDGTIYSAEFTTVEKYDLLIQPADEYSKGKLSEVTVAGTAQTLDPATGKATVTNVAPGAEVKLKANRGYVIEKVEARKPGAAAEPVVSGNVNVETLKVGDIIKGITGVSGNVNAVTLESGRYKQNGTVQNYGTSFSVYQMGFASNGYTINASWGTFTPVDADGNDGNAWIVLKIDGNGPVLGGYTAQ